MGDASPVAPADTSRAAAVDASPRCADDVCSSSQRRCGWCRELLGATRGLRWCSKRCRQAAWRARGLAVAEDLGDTPKRLGYADPPYPGLARRYYQHEPTYAGEVDHAGLLQRLVGFDGWALSTSQEGLRDVLALCPEGVRVAAWVKPIGACPLTRGPHNTWEPVIYMPARFRRPGFRDWLRAQPARGGGSLPGRKPVAFVAWVLQLLGASPVDELVDFYPGTGIVGRVWSQFAGPSSSAPADESSEYSSDAQIDSIDRPDRPD